MNRILLFMFLLISVDTAQSGFCGTPLSHNESTYQLQQAHLKMMQLIEIYNQVVRMGYNPGGKQVYDQQIKQLQDEVNLQKNIVGGSCLVCTQKLDPRCGLSSSAK